MAGGEPRPRGRKLTGFPREGGKLRATRVARHHAAWPGLVAPAVVLLAAIGGAGVAAAQVRPPAPPVDTQRPWLAPADSLMVARRWEEAHRAYLALVENAPDDPVLWLRVALARLELGQPKPAEEAAQTARTLAPDLPDAALVLAQSRLAGGNTAGGIEALEEGIARFPANVALLELMTSVNIGRQEWAKAAGLLRELVRLRPEDSDYRLDLGRILIAGGEAVEARTHLNAALAGGGDAARVHALLGEAAFAEGKGDEAAREYQTSLDLRPNAVAWAGLGSVQFIAGKGELAEQSFRKAIELEPGNPDLHFNLANVLVLLKRPDEAEQALRDSLKLDPSSASAHLNLGVLLLNRMSVAEAQQQLQVASRLEPRMASPHLHLGRIASAQYRFVDARSHYQEFLKRSTDAQERQKVEQVLAQLEQRAVEQEQARARGEVHLLQLMVTTREEADQAVRRARAGEDFFQLAETVSRIASVTGVDVGYVAPTSLNAEFRDAVVALKVDQVTDPLPGRNGFYVFKRID